jgi:hypothetical protein
MKMITYTFSSYLKLQDGRVLVVPFTQGGGSTDTCEEMNITFLQRIF